MRVKDYVFRRFELKTVLFVLIVLFLIFDLISFKIILLF